MCASDKLPKTPLVCSLSYLYHRKNTQLFLVHVRALKAQKTNDPHVYHIMTQGHCFLSSSSLRRRRRTPPPSPLPHPPPPPLPQHATAVTPESFADVVRVCCTPPHAHPFARPSARRCRLRCCPFAYRAAVIHRGRCSPGQQIPLSLNHVRSARPITWTRSWRSRGRCFVRRGGRCRGKETQTNTESTTSSKRGSDR